MSGPDPSDLGNDGDLVDDDATIDRATLQRLQQQRALRAEHTPASPASLSPEDVLPDDVDTVDRAAVERARSSAATPQADEDLFDDVTPAVPVAVESATDAFDVIGGLPEIDTIRREQLPHRAASAPTSPAAPSSDTSGSAQAPPGPLSPPTTTPVPATAQAETLPEPKRAATIPTGVLTTSKQRAAEPAGTAPSTSARKANRRASAFREHSAAPRRGRGIRTVFGLLLGAALVIGTGAVSIVSALHPGSGIARTIPDDVAFAAANETEPLPSAGGTNTLVITTDSTLDLVELATEGGDRSETVMIVNQSGDGRAVSVMAVKRDTWVLVPEYGEAKLSAALMVGGVGRIVQTVQDFFGIRIDHVALIDYAALAAITDAMQGITVENPAAFTSTTQPDLTFARGEIELDGQRALAYLRERGADTAQDTQVLHQQAFFAALLGKIVSLGVLGDPEGIRELLGTTANDIVVDAGFAATASAAAAQLAAAGEAGVRFFTAPTAPADGTTEGDAAKLDPMVWQQIRTAFLADDVATYAAKQ